MNRACQGLAAAVAHTALPAAAQSAHMRLVVGAKNLFDKAPPVAIAETLLYVFQQHSLRGRFVYASLNYKFR